MTRPTALLSKLVDLLVQEWGREAVESALQNVARTRNHNDELAFSSQRSAGTRKKLSAVEQVERSEVSPLQKASLRDLAARFDRKEFLPSNSDVREFLILIGERPAGMKDRSEAFRRLLATLLKFSPERLERLAASTNHSGPSQLGPISDAISEAARSLPRQRD